MHLNDEFKRMTGYGDDRLGSNCRFLQVEHESSFVMTWWHVRIWCRKHKKVSTCRCFLQRETAPDGETGMSWRGAPATEPYMVEEVSLFLREGKPGMFKLTNFRANDQVWDRSRRERRWFSSQKDDLFFASPRLERKV